jgi:serine/threonine protein kinase
MAKGLPDGWVLSDNGKPSEGGQAHVFPVRRRNDDETYALKRLKNLTSAIRRARFKREVEVMRQLRANGLSVVPEVVEADLDCDKPYFVMPWYAAGSLQVAVDGARFRQQPSAAIRLAIRIGEAIEQIHGAEWAHRDLKPANIFETDSSVVLADFGLCLEVGDDDSDRLTSPAEAIGSRLYIAPENESGINERNDQRPADIYAFGKIVWALVAGRDPFAREAFRRQDTRLAAICAEPKLDGLDGFLGLTLSDDVRDRERVTWAALLGELEAVLAVVEGTPRPTPHRPQNIAAVRAYIRRPDVTDRLAGQDRFSQARNWQQIRVEPAMVEQLQLGLDEMTQLQTESGNEFQFTLASWRPQYALADFFSQLNGDMSVPPTGAARVAPRLTALSRSGAPELHLATWSYVTADGVWFARAAVMARGNFALQIPPWAPGADKPLAVLGQYQTLVGPKPIMLEASVAEARAFAKETSSLFIRLANLYVEKVMDGDDLTVWEQPHRNLRTWLSRTLGRGGTWRGRGR